MGKIKTTFREKVGYGFGDMSSSIGIVKLHIFDSRQDGWLSYCCFISMILFEYINIKTPIIINIIPKHINIIVVLAIVGTGRHPDNFCCLNFDFFNLS